MKITHLINCIQPQFYSDDLLLVNNNNQLQLLNLLQEISLPLQAHSFNLTIKIHGKIIKYKSCNSHIALLVNFEDKCILQCYKVNDTASSSEQVLRFFYY